MKYLQLKRIAALTSFVILMSSFIAYRTGAFEKLYNKNSSAIDTNLKADIDSKKVSVVDTPPTWGSNPNASVASTVPAAIPAYMVSSKTTLIIDNKQIATLSTAPILAPPAQKTNQPRLTVIDTNKKPNTDASHQPTQQELTIMASSKSIGIVPAHAQIIDLTPKDSQKKSPVIMQSTKAGYIYRADDTEPHKKHDSSQTKK